MTEADDIRTRMRNVCDYIEDAIAKVNAGEMVTLAGLDDDVASLCDRSIALPPEEATDVQALMAEMIGNLDRLGNALRDYQDRVKSSKAGQ